MFRQREGSQEDHDGDEDSNRRIDIVSVFSLSLPNDESGHNYADIVDGVSNDVNENTQHAEVSTGLRLRHAVLVFAVTMG